ncbi:hypothetical protein MKW94_003543 [Papaver nudicaule]|uniref:Uncharacterized protein n=1 Tax=Papaver nudicaule TaxID=74823 RepID=A0AA42B3H6_PAPNU|nr:hypothetical protein [Papaver nudicaule]
MASNNNGFWGFSSLLSGRLFASDRRTQNNGSHAGMTIDGFNNAGGNNNSYQTSDDNRQKYNGFTNCKLFNDNTGSSIST